VSFTGTLVYETFSQSQASNITSLVITFVSASIINSGNGTYERKKAVKVQIEFCIH